MFLLAFAVSMARGGADVKSNPWERQVFYQIFPRSYRDSNGDRIGDFKGIEEGLPTIQKLGCTAILINPIQKSRFYHNYFADDFSDVDPTFGTMQDFDHLIKTAHRMKIRVVLDMEPQYVANRHPWFIAAAGAPQGVEAGYLAEPPIKASMFDNWFRHDRAGFVPANLSNPAVIEALKGVFRTWSSRGVDGFRIDHMMDDLDYSATNKNLYANLWTPIEQDVKKNFPGSFFVGEQADWDSYRSPVEMFASTPTDACFNFRLRTALMTFKKGIIAKGLDEYKWFTKEGRVQLTFLENHDMNRFASEESDPAKQRLAAAIMACAKGAPIIYYGQELGMKGEQGHFGSDGNDVPVRLAYRWSRNLEAKGTALWYKNTGPWWSTRFSRDHDGVSLEEQQGDPNSLFNWYRKVIRLRRQTPVLLSGSQEVVDLVSETVLAFRRTLGKQSVLVLANMSERPCRLPTAPISSATDLITGSHITAPSVCRFRPWQVKVLEAQER